MGSRFAALGLNSLAGVLIGLGALPALAQSPPESASPAELAQSIARTMSGTSEHAPGLKQVFEARGNVVEALMVISDPKGFATMSARRGEIQAQMTRYLCKGERIAYIRRGVSFRETYSGPGPTDLFEYLVDEKACAALAATPLADAETRARMAKDIAAKISASFASSANKLFTTDPPTAESGLVRVVHTVVEPGFAEGLKAKPYVLRGRLSGFYCGRYGEALRQGVRIHELFRSPDGGTALEFDVDDSVC